MYRVWCGNVKENGYLEALGKDWIIIFIWTLNKWRQVAGNQGFVAMKCSVS
jgi:hypothetical protein